MSIECTKQAKRRVSSLLSREYLPEADAPPPAASDAGSPVAHRAWREARERALAAVRAGGGLVVVLGPPGTGKSLLLRELARALGRDGHDVLLRPRGDVPVETDSRAAGDAAGDAPGEAAGALGPRVVLIDEAHRLDGAALDRLGRLGARHVVLAGVPGSGDGFDRLPARATVVRLAPLPPGEVGAFTAALLARPGRGAPPPSERAVRRLAECSSGVPRALDVLVGASALLAASEGAARIEASHVDRVAATRGGAVAFVGASYGGDEDGGGDARGHAGAELRADAVGPAPGRGRAARRRVALGAALGGGLCAVGGVAGYFAWQSPRSEPRARPEGPVSARADAPLGPTAAATPDADAFVRGPDPGRADAPAAPAVLPTSGPVAPVVAPAAPGPVQAAAAESVAPGMAPVASDPAPPAEPATPGAPFTLTASEPATPVAPAPDTPAAVRAAMPLAPEPVAPAPSGRAAPFVAGPPDPTSAEPDRATARPVLAAETARFPARSPDRTSGPPPAAWALPSGAAVRVVIYHPRDDARAAARAAGIARALREAGMAVDDPLAAPPRGGKPGVRYFFAEDRDAAAAVLERAGLNAEDMPAGDARPGSLPRPGTIEVTLPPG